MCYFRELDDIYNHVDVDPTKDALLQRLKQRLQGKFPQYTYHLALDKTRNQSVYRKKFEQRTYEVLLRSVQTRIQKQVSLTALEQKRSDHDAFIAQRTLTAAQRALLQSRCAENGLPLYLHLALEQAKR